MYILCKSLLKDKNITFPSPFNRKLQSKFPTSVRFYKRYLEKKITKQNSKSKVESLLKIAQQRRLKNVENDELDKVNKNITSIMIESEKK